MAKQTYTQFQTPEKWKVVNKHNKEIISEYELELKSRGKSKNTIKQYINDLKILACYVVDEYENIPFYKLTKKQIRNFVIDLQDNDTSPARINRILSSIRTMLDFAIDDEDYEDLYLKNVASKIKGLDKEKVRDVIFLSMDEITTIYNVLIKKKKYQEALLLSLLIDTAGRKNEIYQIQKSSIKENGVFTNEVVGKGNKKFKLMYNKMTKDTFPLYLEQRGEDDYDFLWYSKSKDGNIEEAKPSKFYYWIKKWVDILYKETGVKKDFNIHSFRHSCLELLSTGEHYICDITGRGKFELTTLQALANHNDISTTNSYLKDKTEDILLEAFNVEED